MPNWTIIAIAVPIGLGIRLYLGRKYPGSAILPTFTKLQDKGLTRAFRWTMTFGGLAGLVLGFLVGMRAEHQFLYSATMDTKAMMFAAGMVVFAALMILATHPPLGKRVRGAEAVPAQDLAKR
jgi:hypothetical protein